MNKQNESPEARAVFAMMAGKTIHSAEWGDVGELLIYFTDGSSVRLAGESPNGEPSGFTREDVACVLAARDGLDQYGNSYMLDDAERERLMSLAARIGALLPPDEATL